MRGLGAVGSRLELRGRGDGEVAGVESNRHLVGRDPPSQLVELVGRGRRLVHRVEGVGRARVDEPVAGEREPGFLDELADRGRASRLTGVAEPAPGERGVAGIDRPAREHDVSRQEPARGAPLHHEHLGAVVALADGHDRRSFADRLAHGRGFSQADYPAGRCIRSPTAIAEVIGLEGPIRFDRFMEMALYAPGGYYDRPPVGPGPRCRLRDEPARAPGLRAAARRGDPRPARRARRAPAVRADRGRRGRRHVAARVAARARRPVAARHRGRTKPGRQGIALDASRAIDGA